MGCPHSWPLMRGKTVRWDRGKFPSDQAPPLSFSPVEGEKSIRASLFPILPVLTRRLTASACHQFVDVLQFLQITNQRDDLGLLRFGQYRRARNP